MTREAFAAGLEPAIKTIAERRRQEAIHTLKKLKIARITAANPTTLLNTRLKACKPSSDQKRPRLEFPKLAVVDLGLSRTDLEME